MNTRITTIKKTKTKTTSWLCRYHIAHTFPDTEYSMNGLFLNAFKPSNVDLWAFGKRSRNFNTVVKSDECIYFNRKRMYTA